MKKIVREQTPKTLECCGLKPKRAGIYIGFRDEINAYEIKCSQCANRVYEDNDYNSEHELESNAVKKWNAMLEARKERDDGR